MFTTTVEGYRPAPDEELRFYYSTVGPDYFQTTGTRLLRGRAFSETDTPGTPQVVIISEAAAKRYWSGRDPLAGRIIGDDKILQIVGVAQDAKVDGLNEEPIPFIYFPFTQDEAGATLSTAHLLVRTTGGVEQLLGPMAEQLRSIDRDAPIFDVSSLAWRLRDLVMPQQMGATLFAVFSLLAVTLAAIGIYGWCRMSPPAHARARHPHRARCGSDAHPRAGPAPAIRPNRRRSSGRACDRHDWQPGRGGLSPRRAST